MKIVTSTTFQHFVQRRLSERTLGHRLKTDCKLRKEFIPAVTVQSAWIMHRYFQQTIEHVNLQDKLLNSQCQQYTVNYPCH